MPLGKSGNSPTYPLILFILLVNGIVVFFINHFYHPNYTDILVEAQKVSFLPLASFHPEPKEKLLTFSFLLSLPLSAYIYHKISITYTIKYLDILISFLFILIAYYTFSTPYLSSTLKFVANYFTLYFFYDNHILSNNIFLYITPCLVCISFYFKKVQNFFISIDWILFGIFNIFLFHLLNNEIYPYIDSSHFHALFFSQYQVSNHHIALCCDGFKNTYGLYPHFLEIVFQYIPLSIENFKAVFIVLINLSFLFLYLFLKRTLDNKYYALVLIFGYMYYMAIYKIDISDDIYFQYLPLRTIFPFLTLYLISKYHTSHSYALFITISIVSALAILWNPDSGIMTSIIWCSYLIYNNLKYKKVSSIFLKSTIYILSFITILVIVFYIYKLYIELVFNQHITFTDLFITISIFSKLGYYLLPLPSNHPYLLYLFLIIISVSLLTFQQKNSLGLLLITLWMISSFLYFQGRSHPYTFLNIIINMFLVLPFILQQLKDKDIFYYTIKYTFFIMASILITKNIIYIKKHITNPKQTALINTSYHYAPKVQSVNFINKYTHKNEQILILDSKEQGLLHYKTHTFPIYNISTVDMFLRNDYQKMLDLIQNKKVKKIFITKKDYQKYKNLLKKRYTIVDNNKFLIYLKAIDDK